MNWMQKDVQTSAQMEIAWQCAPVLTGVKPSNILTLKNVSESCGKSERDGNFIQHALRRRSPKSMADLQRRRDS